MDNIFYSISKIVWKFISPDHFLILLLVIGMVCLYRNKIKAAKRVLTFSVGMLLLLTFFSFGQLFLAPIESRFPTNPQLPEKIHGVIALGGAEALSLSESWQQAEFYDGAERIFTFMRFIRDYPEAKHVFSGGKHPGDQITASAVVQQLLEEQGIDIQEIIFEDRSRNTYENVSFLKELVSPQAGENWILITSASHIPRSVGIFRKQGWDVIAFPVDHSNTEGNGISAHVSFQDNIGSLSTAVYEWVGLTVYYVTGKTSSFFPGPK